ncbi:MAG: 1-deoxy-D-xylulose-5-phosphate reductoisomerase, partial [Luteimonas sp.]
MDVDAGIRRIAVLGATGSIGTSTLDVVARHPVRLRATVLAAGSRVDALLALCRAHRPLHAVIGDEALYPALRDGLRDAGLATEAHAGAEAIDALARAAAAVQALEDGVVLAVHRHDER